MADRETNEAVAEQDVPEQNKEIEQSDVKNESQKLTAVQEESVTEKDAAADTATQTDETMPVEKIEATVMTVVLRNGRDLQRHVMDNCCMVMALL